MTNETNQPVHRIRLSTISASIFKNTSAEGKTFYNAQFDRSYKSGEEWRHTRNFGRNDLPNLEKVVDLAFAWIDAQQASNPAAASEPDTPGIG